MNDEPESPEGLRPPSQRLDEADACSHRGQERDFVRDDRGRVRMICRGCGSAVGDDPGHEAA